MDNPVKSYVSRYVIPFYYDNSNEGYSRIQNGLFSEPNDPEIKLPKDGKWVKAGFWENYKSSESSQKQAEMDLYSYLPGIYDESENGDDIQNSSLGTSYVYRTSGKLLDLAFVKDEEKIPFSCSDIGVTLYKNGIGFIWYEVTIAKETDAATYTEFQHVFKELARPDDKKIMQKTGYDKLLKEALYQPFCMGLWIRKLFSTNELGISFLAQRNVSDHGISVAIPDKALLFQYLFIEKTEAKDKNDLIFRITNGFNAAYNSPDDVGEYVYKPFANSTFYVSKAGMTCVVTNEDSNEEFFSKQFNERYIRDYFFIYLLLLYQSYSCVHFSRLLTELPADENAFRVEKQYVDRLETINNQINLFMVKSVFDSVSNMHHQNGVYRYGKTALSIEEDVRSLTIGLDALRAVELERKNRKEQLEQEEKEKLENEEREIREKKVDNALILFGFLVVISALLDGLNLVDWIMEKGGALSAAHIIISGFVVALAAYLMVVIIKNAIKKR